MSALQKLLFAIGVSDEASGKMLGIQRAVDKTCRGVRQNFEVIKAGALSAAGAGMGLYQMVNPAVDFNRAVGEVRSLGTAEDALAHLQISAKQFTAQYGGSAAEVVRSSYDIQSAIAGLEGKELGTFAMASATLAKGTKADGATITAYMGTMYGIYKQQADKMGRAQWVEQLSGRTAYAVQIFKTTGTEMSSAFTALGANAQAAGISAQEQMAVLGMLQATMGGSEAGTKYKAFLRGVGGAQKELGLKFTDKSGNMLGMDTILEKIKGKFGESLSVKDSDQLKKAFGSDEAVSLIKLLLNDTTSLKKNIADLGRINNMDQAKSMAKSMTDVWARLGGAWDVVRITFAQRMLPTIEKVTDKIVGFLKYIQKCMDIAPGLTGKLGLIATFAISLAGAMGILGMAIAVSKLSFLGLKTVLGPTSFAFKLLKASTIGLKWGFGALKFIGGGLVSLLRLLTLGSLRLAAALLANPMTWIVLGIMALVAGVVALIYYWSDLVAWFENTSWGQTLITMFQDLSAWWHDLTAAFTDGAWVQTLMGLLDSLMAPLRSLGDGVVWVGEKLGIISDESPRVEASGVAALSAPRQSQILPGGVSGQISNATTNNGKSVTIGQITVQSQSMPSLEEMEELGYLS
ncbi:phage tail tape measure protein [Desulfovibrio falkowii]|uniref:Phage tail tape measure protein n=1 Tax=Desulfovibrio falkowii TaxID=3136602 RepID=A0ABQ0EAY7_9BACT